MPTIHSTKPYAMASSTLKFGGVHTFPSLQCDQPKLHKLEPNETAIHNDNKKINFNFEKGKRISMTRLDMTIKN